MRDHLYAAMGLCSRIVALPPSRPSPGPISTPMSRPRRIIRPPDLEPAPVHAQRPAVEHLALGTYMAKRQADRAIATAQVETAVVGVGFEIVDQQLGTRVDALRVKETPSGVESKGVSLKFLGEDQIFAQLSYIFIRHLGCLVGVCTIN